MEKPKLTPQEKLDALYEAKLAVFRGFIALNLCLTKDPNEFELSDERIQL